MPGKSNQVTLTFGGDADQLVRESKKASQAVQGVGKAADDVDKASGKFKTSLGGIGKAFAGAFAANVVAAGLGAVKDFVSGSVEAFSNLNESVNAVGQVFGKNADEIRAWGEKNANSLGLSKRAFNELATPLGALLKNGGLSLNQVTGWTEKLTERAADLASVFNTDVSTALEAIQAGVRGEADPLERFGVSLSAAKVQAEALAETHKKSAKGLTDQELATARLNLIMKQSSAVAGDFRNTSDGLANSQRIAAAKTEELQAKIGEKLAPAVAFATKAKLKLVEVISDKVVPLLTKVAEWAEKNTTAVKVFAIAAGVVLVAAFIAWAVAAASAAIATLAATWPILAIIAAIVLLVAGIYWLWKNWDKVWGWIKKAASNTWDFIKKIPGWIGTAFKAVAGAISAPFRAAFNFISDAWNHTIGKLSWTVPGWIPGIGGNTISVPHLPKFHSGGVVPGTPGQEMLAVLQAGERVTPANRSGGGVTVVFQSNGTGLDDALVGWFEKAVRTGRITVRTA